MDLTHDESSTLAGFRHRGLDLPQDRLILPRRGAMSAGMKTYFSAMNRTSDV